MRLILLWLCILLALPSHSQEKTVYFSDAIKQHLNKYNLQCDLEYERGDLQKGEALFDSLVQNYLVGSRFTDYSLKNVGGGKVRLGKIKKPIFIITYASWCVLNKGEAPALNKLSKKYKDVQFIVLFWDKKYNVNKIARQFSGSIKVCYANEAYRNDSNVVSTLKHTLGFPTSYFLNSNLDVVDIKRGGAVTGAKSTYINAFNLNYNLFKERLANFMLKKDGVKSQSQLADTD
jgi:thiol-disulfide isomerase/thioredoxin